MLQSNLTGSKISKSLLKSSFIDDLEEQEEMMDNDTLRQVFIESYGVEM